MRLAGFIFEFTFPGLADLIEWKCRSNPGEEELLAR